MVPLLWLFCALCARVFADVSIAQPKAGAKLLGASGSVDLNVVWTDDSLDDSSAASLLKVKLYTVLLCTGPTNSIKCFLAFPKVAAGSTLYSAKVPALGAPNGEYFVQVYAVFSLGYTIHYSSRFELTNMKGDASTMTFPASYLSVTGAAPQAQLMVDVGTTQNVIDSALFSVPYTAQTGPTRFAPMQLQPGTTVTATTYLRRFPLSSYTPYLTLRPLPNVLSTLTPGWSYTVTSKINSASVAGYPTYFYAALERVKQATLSQGKRKRWLD